MNFETETRGIVTKDPASDLDFSVNWAEWLGADTITASTWIAPSRSGLTLHSQSVLNGVTTTWMRNGKVGGPYRVVNHIETAAGRKDDRSFLVTVQEK